MSSVAVPWQRLEQWSPIGFIVGGLGTLIGVALLVLDTVTALTVPELVISVFTIPSYLALFAVALPGFYPYIADKSPRLARGGIVAVAVGLLSLVVTIGGSIVLDLLGVSGFMEEGPLLAGFFLMLVAFLLGIVLYGIASVRTGEPSRAIGVLLVLVVVEPGTALLNDLVGVDIGINVAYLTLGFAGVAFLAIGLLLRTAAVSADRAEPTPETPA